MVQSKNYSLLPKTMYYTSQSVHITIMIANLKCVLSKRSQFLLKPQRKCITRWWNDFIVKNNCNNACLALFDIACKNFSSTFSSLQLKQLTGVLSTLYQVYTVCFYDGYKSLIPSLISIKDSTLWQSSDYMPQSGTRSKMCAYICVSICVTYHAIFHWYLP